MKRTWMMITFAAAVVTATAHAQELKANVPFDFAVGGKLLPAGSYSVSTLAPSGVSGVLVRNSATRESALLIAGNTTTSNRSGSAELVFHCQANRCAVAAVHTPNGITRVFATPRVAGVVKERVVALQMSAATAASGF